jgi:hypothetical protein
MGDDGTGVFYQVTYSMQQPGSAMGGGGFQPQQQQQMFPTSQQLQGGNNNNFMTTSALGTGTGGIPQGLQPSAPIVIHTHRHGMQQQQMMQQQMIG